MVPTGTACMLLACSRQHLPHLSCAVRTLQPHHCSASCHNAAHHTHAMQHPSLPVPCNLDERTSRQQEALRVPLHRQCMEDSRYQNMLTNHSNEHVRHCRQLGWHRPLHAPHTFQTCRIIPRSCNLSCEYSQADCWRRSADMLAAGARHQPSIALQQCWVHSMLWCAARLSMLLQAHYRAPLRTTYLRWHD